MDWAQMACHRCLVYLGDLCKNLNLSFSLFWATGQAQAASVVGINLYVVEEQEVGVPSDNFFPPVCLKCPLLFTALP